MAADGASIMADAEAMDSPPLGIQRVSMSQPRLMQSAVCVLAKLGVPTSLLELRAGYFELSGTSSNREDESYKEESVC